MHCSIIYTHPLPQRNILWKILQLLQLLGLCDVQHWCKSRWFFKMNLELKKMCHFVPRQFHTLCAIVALGVKKRSAIISKLMQKTPFYPTTHSLWYASLQTFNYTLQIYRHLHKDFNTRKIQDSHHFQMFYFSNVRRSTINVHPCKALLKSKSLYKSVMN